MKKIILTLFIVLSSAAIYGQKPKKLFRSDSILEFSITLPIKEIIKNKNERIEHASVLSFTEADGTEVNYNIKVKLRGNTRALNQICTFPPLQLRFNKKETTNSIFKGQKKLKLVTHCQYDRSFQEYIQREYLVYKLYQVISPYSFNVRLCKIKYIDANKPKDDNFHYGFLIEKISDVAKRNDVEVFKGKIRNQENINKDNLDKLIFFEYLIGNLDWSISERHNMKLVKGDKGALPIAVPYDFDYSGLVNTPYAIPPEEFNIPDVRTRVFRGYCRSDNYKETIEYYQAIEDQLRQEVTNLSILNDKSRNSITKYFDSFYKNLSSDKFIDKKIARACKVKHKHAYEYE